MASQLFGEVFFALCKSVDTAVSLKAWLLYKHHEQHQLAEMQVDPKWYNTASAFFNDYNVVSYVRKYFGLETGIDKQKVALEAFAGFEDKCRITNKVFSDPHLRGLNPRVHELLHSMQRKIAYVLGDLKVGEVLKLCKWGNGASSSLKRREAYVDSKISEVPLGITFSALPYARAFLEVDYHWFATISGVYPDGPYSVLDSAFRVERGDVLDTVPKDATTDRTIGKTPTALSFLQQGAGRFIRKRLQRVGVNLNDQTVNQTWASLAYDLDLCTLDLKGASDTIARQLVFQLLPPDWSMFLDALRSPFMKIGSEWKRLEKFSAMGTAFTFELESLIFWAALSAATEASDPGGVISVYGDDLICSRTSSDLVIALLSSLGFTLNARKSHVDGKFFESCGKHYYEGYDVTPIFQKEVLEVSSPFALIRAHNRLFRALLRQFDGRPVDIHNILPLENAINALLRHSDSVKDYRIPWFSEGDDGLLAMEWEFDYCENHGYLCRVLQEHRTTRRGRGDALLALSLRLSSDKDYNPLGYLYDNDVSLSEEDRRDEVPRCFAGLRWVQTRLS